MNKVKVKNLYPLKLQLITLADQVITGVDKKNTVVGIFDKIFVKGLPAIHNRMTLFMTFIGEPGSKEKVDIQIIKPSGGIELNKQIELPFEGDTKANILFNLEGFPVNETGEYKIIVKRGESELGEFAFEVIRVKEQDERATLLN